jgi:hypothetical protein
MSDVANMPQLDEAAIIDNINYLDEVITDAQEMNELIAHPSFEKLIVKGYIEDFALRNVQTVGMAGDEERTRVQEKMISRSHLFIYIQRIIEAGQKAVIEKQELEQMQSQLAKESE